MLHVCRGWAGGKMAWELDTGNQAVSSINVGDRNSQTIPQAETKQAVHHPVLPLALIPASAPTSSIVAFQGEQKAAGCENILDHLYR